MKTLILSDETFAQMERALGESARGRSVLAAFDARPELPPDRELVALSREPDSEPPEVIARARDHRIAGIQAAEDTRLALNELLRQAYAAGVRPTVLSRWFGLRPTRVYEIIGPV